MDMIKTFPVDAQRKYLRIPFKGDGRDFNGCDCGGIICLIYKEELGVILPNWAELYKNSHVESFTELTEIMGGMLDRLFAEVPKGAMIQPYDVIVFNIAGSPIHVGLAVNNNVFMHIMEGYTSVRTERLDSINWKKRIDGVFRYMPKAGK